MNVQPDPLLKAIQAHVRLTGSPLTVEDIERMANFRQPGGVTRLCAALAKVSANYCAQMERQP